MRAILCATLMLSALSARADDALLLESAKRVAVIGLKDPSSAQFRNLEVRKAGKSMAVCGEINAKNSYGGYVGFVKFYVLAGSATPVIQDGSVRDQMVDSVCKPPS